ncbi:hypothetical protein [Pararhizobium sp. LjRoot238]|uniref:hypothetical protein n=1 Tax=Pararhizobium sp. LjRoot238 TaxID=3342293 RepID=UPI003ECDEA77
MSTEDDDFFPPEYVAANKAQAADLRPQAAERGLRFEGYLVPSVAEWVLAEVEQGRFRDPSEAVFVAMQVFMEMQSYPDLREELLRREIRKSLADEGPTLSGEEVLANLKERMKRAGGQKPPMWSKVPFPS